jgi:hypothetical protein
VCTINAKADLKELKLKQLQVSKTQKGKFRKLFPIL